MSFQADPIVVDTTGLRADYERVREELARAFRDERDPDSLLKGTCRAADEALLSLWRMCGFRQDAALLAVGGYGRGELFPYSDVDLLLLVAHPPEGELAQQIETFVGACWDLGMAIGHSVRTVQECLDEQANDITVRTALFERRRLTKANALTRSLEAALEGTPEAAEFFNAKTAEMRQRHEKFANTPYSLEPNTKESPGGLRDLQTLRWVASAAGLGKTWSGLRKSGLVTGSELQMLRHNERQLKRIRVALHLTADRPEDRLIFDMQGAVADLLGYSDRQGRRASEQLMQRYYRAAKTVTQLTTILLQNIDAQLGDQSAVTIEPLNDEFCSRNGLLQPNDLTLFQTDPSAILRAFIQLQQQGLRGMTTATWRAMWNARTLIDAGFRRDPANRQLFVEILQAPMGVTHALRWMNQWSILGHYLPAFRRIVGRMQHDLFHVYTVDQHIMTVVRNLRRFARPEHAHEFPVCSQLMATFDQSWLIVLGALFHDIAKGRGGDHSTLGAVEARRFCRQHGISNEDTALVAFLVEHHLTMSTVAQKKDLSDPETIANFAEIVQTEERLSALYILTVADIRGTSPKVWNGWKAKLLEDLYRHTKRYLAGDQPDRAARIGARRREAIRILDLYAIDPDSYQQFWESLDIGYFMKTEGQDMAWHARVLSAHVGSREPIVKARLSPFGEGFQVCVYLPDQEDLFTRLCGYFDSANLSVLDAQIHTTSDGYALDTFLVTDRVGDTAYRVKLALVENDLTRNLTDQPTLKKPSQSRPSRRSRSFPIKPSVKLMSDTNQQRYVLTVMANDRPGLLYAISLTFAKHGISIYIARIMTLGERVEDTFVIDGHVLSNPKQQLSFEAEVLETLRLPK
ncbi:MAG: [protein-PII] uridylyltransferase [Burkholderiaceae bacterium]